MLALGEADAGKTIELAAGETIVVNGQNNLKDNVAVTVLQ